MSFEAGIQFALDVANGNTVACNHVKNACDRFINDLENPLFSFDADAARHAVNFFPKCIRHVKGALANQPYEPSDWESFILINLFGFKNADTGLRRFRTAYVEVARKNSKSTFCSGIALYMTAYDKEGGAEVYSAATTRDQARIVFGDAQNMIKSSPRLKKTFGVHKLNIHHMASASKFEPLSADANTLDGLNVHCAIVDEIHAHKTRDVWDVIETATGARQQPLILAITTAGFNKLGIGFEQREYVSKVLSGTVDDPTYFGIIFTLDDDDDPFDESNWVKANPNLGRSKQIDDMRRLAKKAQEMPTARNNFLTKHLNMWVNAETAWLDMLKWNDLKESPTLEHLRSMPCYIGLDLSNKLDITAIAFLFDDSENGVLHTFYRFYLPEDAINYKPKSIGNLYDTWGKQDFLTLTDGNIIDHRYIEQDLIDLCTSLNVQTIAFDPWGSTQLSISLSEKGLPMAEMPQTVKNLSEAMKEVEARVLSGRITKPVNPVIDWMASNVTAKIDRNENVFPNKAHADNKIDGMVALFMAMNRYLASNNDHNWAANLLANNDGFI